MPTIEFRTFHDKSHDLFRPVAEIKTYNPIGGGK